MALCFTELFYRADDGIVLVYKNKPQVVLRNIAIHQGGKVTVNDAQLVGDLAEIQNLEIGLVGILKLYLAAAIAQRLAESL